MLQFEYFVARHGEVGAQAIIENLERFEGMRCLQDISLETRWRRLMQNTAPQAMAA